ncbi:MAG TPA: hypothetical protein VMT70_10720 [Vicinamibacteria bacterium]|nr:hypothetical protein [Vicinamibacteria bacterium]
MGSSVTRSVLATWAVLALPCAASAGETPSARPWSSLEESLGASFNRLGLQNQLELSWGQPLTESRNALLADAHLGAGFTHTLTPSYTRLGAWVEAAPLSILVVRAGAEPSYYFGTFGSLMSFGSYDDDFSDRAREARASDARPGSAVRFHVSPTVRMRLGSFAVASSAALEWWASTAAGPLFYEPARDTLLKAAGDRLLLVSSVLVRERRTKGGGTIRFGLSHDLTYVMDAPGNRCQKLGLVFARRLAGRHLGLPSPWLGAGVGYYLDDPTRKGQVTAGVGLSMERSR